ncbi:MAG TPA: carboxypeptidase-like regulatory domain-containing protein [Kofleriaceae bacterium]|jgi:hypothetical protein
MPAPALAADAPAQVVIGDAALPGGIQAPDADLPAAGSVTVGALGSFGYRKGLLNDAHVMQRLSGDVAVAYAPIKYLAVALSLDGRYDRHTHTGGASDTDSGTVGDPHLVIRGGAPAGPLAIGAQVDIWVPGKDAPSVDFGATTIDARALLAFPLGPAHGSLSFGYRYDNSAKSVGDAALLSNADRVSLGVSDEDAIVGSVHVQLPLGTGFVAIEGNTAIQGGTSIFGGAISGGMHFNRTWSGLAFIEYEYQSDLGPGAVPPLREYPAAITGGLALSAHFGGAAAAAAGPSVVVENEQPKDVVVDETADLNGQVNDEAGKPVVGAKVTVTLRTHSANVVTDESGKFSVPKLPIGKTAAGVTTLDDTGADVTVDVDGKKPAHTTLTLAKGANHLQPIQLEPVLPPGQLRAVIKSLASGKPVANAKVSIVGSTGEGGTGAPREIASGTDGTFQIDLPPGQYKLVITAPGFAPQQLDVTIDPNGVAIKNIDLHR